MNPFQKIFADMKSAFVEEPTEKSHDKHFDVISLIKADHRNTDKLFQRYMKSKDDAEKDSILQEIINDLRVHATAEESKVYPLLDSADHEGTSESFEEHHLIKILIEELSSNRLAEDKIDAKVKVLSEVVQHHVKEEESKYLPELKDSGADLKLIGENFASEKERLMGEVDVEVDVEVHASSKSKSLAKSKAAAKAKTKTKSIAKETSAIKAPAKKLSNAKTSAKPVGRRKAS